MKKRHAENLETQRVYLTQTYSEKINTLRQELQSKLKEQEQRKEDLRFEHTQEISIRQKRFEEQIKKPKKSIERLENLVRERHQEKAKGLKKDLSRKKNEILVAKQKFEKEKQELESQLFNQIETLEQERKTLEKKCEEEKINLESECEKQKAAKEESLKTEHRTEILKLKKTTDKNCKLRCSRCLNQPRFFRAL